MKQKSNNLREFLVEIRDALPAHAGGRYKNPVDLVLREGECFQSTPLTPGETEVVRNAMSRKTFPPKLCFHNAQRVVLADPTGSLDYVEGYTTNLIHHAWAAIGSKVIDVTLRHTRDGRPILGVLPPGREYMGVRVSRPYLGGAQRKRSVVALLDDWQRNFPILRDDPKAWMVR